MKDQPAAGFYVIPSGTMTTTVTPATLAPNTPIKIVAQRNNRSYLCLQVAGTGSATFGFGQAPAAGTGISLDGASAANGQGGSYEFKDRVPTDSIWAISTAGTTVTVAEGVKNS